MPHPLAHCNGQGLALKVCKRGGRPDDLVGLFPGAGANRYVVMFLAALGHGYESRRGKDFSRIAKIQIDSLFHDPWLVKVICTA